MSGGRKKACDTCHARKIYCDGALPNCDWCSHQGLVCTFERGTRKSAARRSRSTRNVAYEKPGPVLVDSTSSSTLDVPVPASSSRGTLSCLYHSPPTSIPEEHIASYLFSPPSGQDWILGSSPFFPTERILHLISPVPTSPPWQRENHRWALSVETTVADLPEKNIAEQYLQLFRSTPFRLVFPLIDTVLFQATINSAYEPDDSSVSSCSRACVFSFLSIMSQTQWNLKSPAVVNSDACARQAELLMARVPSEANIVRLQCYVMQCMYQLFSGNLQLAITYHAIACRMLFLLGGHLDVQPTSKDRGIASRADRERRTKVQLRKLFWLCYTFDKVLALRTGQPSCINDEHCDLTLPAGYADMLYREGDFDAAPSTTLCFFPGDLRLSIIKSRICKLLNFGQAQKLSDTEILRIVRELDDELESWRMSIPFEYRPTLSSRDNGHGFDPAMDSSQKMHIIIIHLEYHHLMATIHRTVSRSLASNSGDVVNQGLVSSSSQALSVEASRASLGYLRVAAHALMGPTFWIIVFYPMSAILIIIGNILLNPLDPQVEHDMKQLEFTVDLIKQIRSQRWIPIDNLDISRMDSFASEIIRYGKCAIAAARSESRDDFCNSR